MFNEWGISECRKGVPLQGMLGTTGGRLMGPSGSAQLHHRNVWPPIPGRSFEFQTNGEVTESLFGAGGYNTPPANSPFLPVPPLELVTKNFQTGTVAFSQANSSIFVQSHTDFIAAKKTETCIGRWEQGEPLQIHIKREPCQVSEVTTSNNIEANTNALTAVVKIEAQSPKTTTMDHINGINSTQSTASIPVGIAVARQRLQETQNLSPQMHPCKEMNRFGVGLADLVGCTTPSLSQNMLFTGTNSAMIPLTSETVTMGVTNVQNSVRSPPTLWQYPAPLPVESMLPMPPMPPVGFQLVRDPTTGQILFLPTATTIDKVYISCVEPFQQAVVWPSYPQQTQLQPPHLLLPQMTTSQLQPPPLAPLQMVGSDYLSSGSTTLHQHTQTHSTRLVSLSSDKRTKHNQTCGASISIPMPIPSHTYIKIEDCSGTTSSTSTSTHHHIYEQEKTIQDMFASDPPQLIYHNPAMENLIQLPQQTKTIHAITPPPSTLSASESPQIQPTVTSCLTPPPEKAIISEEIEASSSSHSLPPEVQDANIQTDTPVMSEDDNTNGADETMHDSAINTLEESHCSAVPTTSSFDVLCHSIINSSDSAIEPDMSVQSNNISNCEQVDMDVEEEVSSFTAPTKPLNLKNSTKKEFVEEDCENIPQAHSNILISNNIMNNNINNENREEQESPVDLSGLELLSQSIEVFQNKTMIKKEPVDMEQNVCHKETPDINNEEEFINTDEPMGGLDILCALAEKRFQEEVHQRNTTEVPLSPETTSQEDIHGKKRKHKHSSSRKSSKKSKHEKECKKDRKRKHSSDGNDDEFGNEMKKTLSQLTAKFAKCLCEDNEEVNHHCCRTNWPTANELFNVMETDMKERLADIMRQCEQKKKELEEINLKNLVPITPNYGGISGMVKIPKGSFFSNPTCSNGNLSSNVPEKISIPALSPNFSSSSNSFIELPKLSSDTDSSKFEDMETSSAERLFFSKRKGGIPKKHDEVALTETIVAKKPKSLVGYILASKNKVCDSDEVKELSQSSYEVCKSKATSSATDDTDSSLKPQQMAELLSSYCEDENSKQSEGFSIFGTNPFVLDKKSRHKSSSKHHSKHKKARSKERKRRHSEKKNIDSKCMLTKEHLEKDKVRVLTTMGGLFYAGCMSAIQPPDIYAITLDGERGNRPHIMTREEILRDVILEIAPKTADEIIPGTRLCAYWSQQYRCLYPGVAAEPASPDPEMKFVNVEFDDGDNGRILLEDIRYLMSDYPIVEYDPNPLLSLGKRKRNASQSASDIQGLATVNTDKARTIQHDTYREEKRRMKKIKKHKLKHSVGDAEKHKRKYKFYDDLCKHKKHKKRRKHKKHHRYEASPTPDTEIESKTYVVQQLCEPSSVVNNNMVEEMREEKPQTTLEEECGSSVAESSTSCYEPKKSSSEKNKSSEKCSKIAAFLPARQLWAWSGKGFKRSSGRIKKQFYKSIQRGKELISVGDNAVFLSTGRPDRPYIGHIESMWETTTSNMVVRVKWFYHPEETQGCPNLKYPGALFDSPHEDENDVQTISHKCEVLPLIAYTTKFGSNPKMYESIYDNNDTYYLAGHYDPTSITIKMQPDIATLDENEKWI